MEGYFPSRSSCVPPFPKTLQRRARSWPLMPNAPKVDMENQPPPTPGPCSPDVDTLGQSP